MRVTWNVTRKRRELKSADGVVLSVPKSGRTWVRVMLARYFSLAAGRELDLERPEAKRAGAPRLFYTHEHWSHRGTHSWRRRLLGHHVVPDRLLAGKAVVVVCRDPRDMLVSLYFHALKRSRHGFSGAISELVRDPHRGAEAVVATMNDWRARLRHHPRALWVSYESLHERPEQRIAEIVRLLGHEPADAWVAEAVTDSRFDRMQQREAEGFYPQRFLNPGDRGDPDSYKVRSGKVGDYHRHLYGDDLAVVNTAVARLDPFYGYGD